MKPTKIIICLAVMVARLAIGQEVSAQWYQEKELSWEQARAHFPESAQPGRFKARMLKIDAWAKENNASLYYSSQKPFLLAQMVQREIDDLSASQRKASAKQRAASDAKQLEIQAIAERRRVELIEAEKIQRLSAEILIASVAGFLAVMMGFSLSRHGVSRTTLWISLGILAPVVMIGNRSHGDIGLIAGVCYAFVIGMRAKNAGYNWWLAGLTALPLISIPFVIHLLFRKGNALTTEEFDRKWLSQSRSSTPVTKEVISTAPCNLMKNTEFEVEIPEGKAQNGGYVEMRHNTQYTVNLRNHRQVPCDAEVIIDGTHVGTWRVNARDEIRIERPVHDTGHFTFFELGTHEADRAEISRQSENGLISVTFKPEKERDWLEAAPLSRPDFEAGATGLTGHSQQRFSNASEIEHDMARCFTIHLRLVSRREGIRPLLPRSTPIPPPVG